MSSIYKKGRDGYYYYQAYIFNPETKKNDKKIYHSLKTKNSDEAKDKQKILDLRYQAKISTLNSFYWPVEKIKKTLFIFLFMFSFYSILVFYDQSSIKKNTKYDFKEKKELAVVTENNKASELIKFPEKEIKVPLVKISQEQFKGNDTENIRTFELSNTTIPKHTIVRVEKVSDLFQQAKIYATIDKKNNSNRKLLVCRSIIEKYKQFSNLTVFIFSDDEIGEIMANEKELNIHTKDRQLSWLAMYSYNPVEGEYFDDNPTGYLGGK